MAYAILRTAKLKTMGEIGGSLAHNYRTRETPNADAERTQDNEHHGGETPEAVLQAIRERLPEKRRSDAVLCVEYLITASPEHFQDNDGAAYFASAVEWLKDKHGAANVVATSIHKDETSPHLVAYVVPLDDLGKLNAKQYLGGKAKLSAMQTDFAEQVGRKHGLERGLEGSRASHTSIREYYGRVGQAQEKTPSVDVPEPSMGERMNVKAYGDRVAKAVIEQLAPELRQLRAKAAETDAAKREAKQARAALEDLSKRLEPVLKVLAPLNERERLQLVQVVAQVGNKIMDARQQAVQDRARGQTDRSAQQVQQLDRDEGQSR
jgi:hypothetical protein